MKELNIEKIKSNTKQLLHSIITLFFMIKLPPSFLSIIIIYGYLFTTLFIYINKSEEENINIIPTMVFTIFMIMIFPGYVDIALPN